MKRIILNALVVLFSGLIFSCEKDIYPELETAEPQFVVDAFITDLPEVQKIRLAQSLPYYQAETLPPLRNATVSITDDQGKRYDFVEGSEVGTYEWTPTVADPVFGEVGRTYTLEIISGNTTVNSTVSMGRVPDVDTVIFAYEEESPFNAEGYTAEFFAVDPVGPGDTYWIKTFKNNEYLNLPSEINVAYDAAFSAGGNVDGTTFILPIRRSINPQDVDEDGNLLKAYEPDDSIRVEIHSISNLAFDFFLQMQEQIDRPGGFGELFAVPLANLPTNLQATGPFENRVVGFFNVAAVSSKSNWLDPNNLPPKGN